MTKKVKKGDHTPVFGGFGQLDCPGLAKMTEENGEAGQIIGKIYQIGGMGSHWDGKDLTLKERLEDEIADQMAAISFFSQYNDLDMDRVDARVQLKFAKFEKWHRNVLAGRTPNDDGDGE